MKKGRSLSDKKGKAAEEIAFWACRELKGERKIKDFHSTGIKSGIQSAGKDIIIDTNDGKKLPIEIK